VIIEGWGAEQKEVVFSPRRRRDEKRHHAAAARGPETRRAER
jgi:hypothetical protein